VAVVIGTSSAAPGNLLTNAGFESGLAGWHVSAPARLQQVRGGHSGSHAVQLSASRRDTVALRDSPNAVSSTRKGNVYSVSAWVRTPTPSVTAVLRIREVHGASLVAAHQQRVRLTDSRWHKLSFHYRAAGAR